MKKIVSLSMLLLVANAARASQPQQDVKTQQEVSHKTYYTTAKMSLSLLEKKAAAGDMVSVLALYDFHENCKNPNYKITYPSSKKALNELDLLDSDGNVHRVTREAFEYMNTKATPAAAAKK